LDRTHYGTSAALTQFDEAHRVLLENFPVDVTRTEKNADELAFFYGKE
jgi:hypothetical protein